MSQNDFNIANQGFPATRADINSALQALASNSAGTAEPSTTYAYQFWYDETNELLKMRNSDNDAWITIGTFDQTGDTFTPAGVTTDKIEEGNSSVEVVDTGTGYVAITVDGVEAARFDANGRLGIGTTSPEGSLDIAAGSGDIVSNLDGSPMITYRNGSGSWFHAGKHPSQDAFVFTMGATSTSTELMRIDSSGKVYIGRTSDPYMSTGAVKRLAIDGGTTSTDATIVSNKNSASTMYHFYFHNSNSVVGSISTNSYATSFNTSSDYRLKENVVDITGAIERLNALSPKRFNWIDDEENKTVDGFLAHEAAEVVPEAITGTYNETQTAYGVVRDANGKVIAKDVAEEDWSANVDDLYPSGSTWAASEELPVYQSIDQSKLVPLLTAALQEALQKIDALEARVTALEG
jgi:hypothetical protein